MSLTNLVEELNMGHGNAHIRPAFRQWGYHSCGHCQTNLPCSDRIPNRRKGRDS